MEDSEKPRSLLRRVVPWLSVVIAIAAIYDGSIFYSRWSQRQAAEKERKAKEVAHAREVVKLLGGDALKILTFYAIPATIRAGQDATLCYGVNGAKTVRMDPPAGEVWPALSRCLQVSPRRDTEYKLTADDGAGHTMEKSFVVKVKR